MAVLIDASILIEAERGRLDLGPHVARHGDEELASAELRDAWPS